MSAAREQRYRSALRWYPQAWREHHADAMLGTLLDVADAEHRVAPSRRELLHLAVSGIRARISPVARVLPSSVRDKASGVALGFGFGLTIMFLVLQEWAPWATIQRSTSDLVVTTTVGPFTGWGGVLYSAWVLGFVLFAVRRETVGRWLLIATVPFSIVLVLVDGGTDAAFRPTTYGLAILGSLACIAALGRPFTGRFSGAQVSIVAIFTSSAVAVPYLTNIALDDRQSPRGVWGLVSLSQGIFAWTIYIIAAIAVMALVVGARSWAGAMVVVSMPIVVISLVMLTDQRAPAIWVLATVAVGFVLGTIVFWKASGFRLQLVRRS